MPISRPDIALPFGERRAHPRYQPTKDLVATISPHPVIEDAPDKCIYCGRPIVDKEFDDQYCSCRCSIAAAEDL